MRITISNIGWKHIVAIGFMIAIMISAWKGDILFIKMTWSLFTKWLG